MRYHLNVTKIVFWRFWPQAFFVFSTHGCFSRGAPSQGLLLLEGSQFGGSEAGGVFPPKRTTLPGCLNVPFLGTLEKETWLAGKLPFFIGDTDTSSFCWLVFHCLLFGGDYLVIGCCFGLAPKNGGRVFSSEFLGTGDFLKLKYKVTVPKIYQFHQLLKKLPKQTIITIR